MEREERIKNEEKRIKSILKAVPKDIKKTAEKLSKRAAFLLILTEDIEEKLNENTDFLKVTINASQEFVKANPLLKEYRDTVKSYQSVIKQLTDLAAIKEKDDEPKDKGKPDDFLTFCMK